MKKASVFRPFYTRKTTDVFEIHINEGNIFHCIYVETSRQKANKFAKLLQNTQNNIQVKIIKKRINVVLNID